MTENVLYYGDNLDVLRRHIADESVFRSPFTVIIRITEDRWLAESVEIR